MISKVWRAYQEIRLINKAAANCFLKNCLLIRLGKQETKWKIRGNTYALRDSKFSQALPVIYKEIIEGLYDYDDLRQMDVVLDLGAHVGAFSIPLAKEFPLAQFYCVEPSIINYSNLRYNILKNNIKNIKTLRMALDITNGVVFLNQDTDNSGATTTSKTNTSSDNIVKSITFNDLLILIEVNKIKLLKVDIEGSEVALLPFINTIKSTCKTIILEIHTEQLTNNEVDKLKALATRVKIV